MFWARRNCGETGLSSERSVSRTQASQVSDLHGQPQRLGDLFMRRSLRHVVDGGDQAPS